MLSYQMGIVKKIQYQQNDYSEVTVIIDDKEARAINYGSLTGAIEIGDQVIVNTTAMELGLGTGGAHFVIYNTRHSEKPLRGPGHIMKLRYTPMQLKVLAAEEQNSSFHQSFIDFKSLDRLPVLVAELHSMLLPLVCTLKYRAENLKIAYIMTDGAALPIELSRTVSILKQKKLLDKTITIGHSFGGDYECVNIYNGLIAAKEIVRCHVAIVTMGPGIVGTSTPFGFSGVEQGPILDAVYQLGGTSIFVPRISFSDQRKRHQGISHHSLTVLDKLTHQPTHVILPKISPPQREVIVKQINSLKNIQKHYIVEVDGSILKEALNFFQLEVNTMGRGFHQDEAFFLACGAAAQYGLTKIGQGKE